MISISDDYSLMKTWLIDNFGGPARIVGDIVGNLVKNGKPMSDNRKQKFSFFAAIKEAIQRLEKLSRVSYINGTELEAFFIPKHA